MTKKRCKKDLVPPNNSSTKGWQEFIEKETSDQIKCFNKIRDIIYKISRNNKSEIPLLSKWGIQLFDPWTRSKNVDS